MRHIPLIWEYVALYILSISGLSTEDFINLVANYTCLLTGEKDNKVKLENRGYTEAQLKAVQGNRKQKIKSIMGLKFSRPLTDFKYPLLNYVLVLLENYERGNLPFPGSISEQPAQIIEILNTLQSVKLKYQQDQSIKS